VSRARAVALAVGALLALPLPARAHSAGLSRGEYRLDDEGTLSVEITFARAEVSDLVPTLDGNLDGVVTPDEVAAARPSMRAVMLGGMKVVAGGAPCPGTLEDARLVEGDGLSMSFVFHCARAPEATLTLDFLDTLRLGHRHLVTMPDVAAGGAPFAYREQKTVTVPAVAVAKRLAARVWLGLARDGARASVWALALLAALLAAGGPRRDVAWTAGAFVAALYASALASFAGFAPVARLVPPALGVALLYAGAENLATDEGVRGRWPVALALGSVAGFHLAGALRDVVMPVRERALAGPPFAAGTALAAIVLGLAAVLALPALSRRSAWAAAAPVAGFAALAAGAWWLVLWRS